VEEAAEEGVTVLLTFIMNGTEGEVIGVQFFLIVELTACLKPGKGLNSAHST